MIGLLAFVLMLAAVPAYAEGNHSLAESAGAAAPSGGFDVDRWAMRNVRQLQIGTLNFMYFAMALDVYRDAVRNDRNSRSVVGQANGMLGHV